MRQGEKNKQKLDLEMAFARVVRRERESRALTQESLASLTKLHRTYISQLERGLKSPSLRTVELLAHALKISISDLIRAAEREQSRSVE